MKPALTIPDTMLDLPREFEFKELLLEAVDQALSMLGDSARQAIYLCLEKTYRVKKQDIPDKIQKFTHAIERIFGPGAKLIQIQIMKNLYERVGDDFEYYPEKSELLFIEYVAAVEASYVQARTQRLPVPQRLF